MYVLLNAHLTALLNSNLSSRFEYIIIIKSIFLNEEYWKIFYFIFLDERSGGWVISRQKTIKTEMGSGLDRTRVSK